MPLTQDVIEAAADLAAAVVRDWTSLADSSPWAETVEPIDEDHLADLIRCLGEAALARQTGAGGPSKSLIRAAIQHGRDRSADRFTEEMLFREYHLLRRGLWEELKRRDVGLAAETIVQIDAEITLATAASLHGFHLGQTDADEESLADQIARRWST